MKSIRIVLYSLFLFFLLFFCVQYNQKEGVRSPASGFHLELGDGVSGFVRKYEDRIAELKNGDTVGMGGPTFQLIEYLGHGEETHVWKVKKLDDARGDIEYALRIPRDLTGDRLDLFNYYPVLYKELTTVSNLPIPKLYESLNDRYILMELLSEDFDGEAFIYRPFELTSKLLADAREDFVTFMSKFYLFSYIMDFHPKQILYSHDKRMWYFADWGVDLFFFYEFPDQYDRFLLDKDKLFSEMVEEEMSSVWGDKLHSKDYKRLTYWHQMLYDDVNKVVHEKRAEWLGRVKLESYLCPTLLRQILRPRHYF